LIVPEKPARPGGRWTSSPPPLTLTPPATRCVRHSEAPSRAGHHLRFKAGYHIPPTEARGIRGMPPPNATAIPLSIKCYSPFLRVSIVNQHDPSFSFRSVPDRWDFRSICETGQTEPSAFRGAHGRAAYNRRAENRSGSRRGSGLSERRVGWRLFTATSRWAFDPSGVPSVARAIWARAIVHRWRSSWRRRV
jgi:hypothetical protein